MDFIELLELIDTANDDQLSRITQAVIERYGRIYPDQEICFLSFPKYDDRERKRIIDFLYSQIIKKDSLK